MGRNDKYIPVRPLPRLTAKANSHQITSAFMSQRTNKRNMANLVCQLKNLGITAEVNKGLSRLFCMVPDTRRVIWGHDFPHGLADLGNGDNCFFYEPKSLEREVAWAILGLRPYKQQLTAFVGLRDRVERHILLGEYDEASQLLAECVKQFGYSLWYYEMRLTIAGYQDHIEDCFSLLTRVNEAYKKKNRMDIVPILLQDLCNRSISRSPLQYDNLLLSHFKRNRTESNRFDYFLFRLNYYQYYRLENLAEMVEMDHMNSVIDRYTTLLYVLRSNYIVNESQHTQTIRFASQLYGITADQQLLPFLALKKNTLLPDSYYDARFIAILDDYYTGRYDACASLCRTYLESNPSNLYVVKLYCRSLMFLRKGFRAVTRRADSILNAISLNIYKVMVEKENKSFVENLNVILKNIYGLRIAAALNHYVKAEQREAHSDLMAYLCLIQFDPFFIRVFDNEQRQKAYLETGLHHIPNSAAISYRMQCLERDISSESPVVAYIRDVDTAKIIFERGDYLKALQLWQHIFDANRDSIPTAQTAVEYIFHCLVSLGTDYRREAVNFYVDCYINNRAYVSKVITHQFMASIKQSRYEGLRTDINLMIFVFLNAEKYPQKQFVLERYCKYERVTYPSELIPKLSNHCDCEKVELFFAILLSDDILYHHYKLRSTMAVLDEKLKIVNFLMSRYPESTLYSRIHTELMHEIVAYRGMVRLDDSKIYVNEDAVMKYELCDIEPLYERFCKQASLAREGHRVLLLGEFSLSGLKEIIKDETIYSTDAVADVAGELFSIIRHAFLKSRFGLGTYLSTRIRHGVFEGEMRSFLQRLDLILDTEQGAYVAANTRWLQQYHLDSTAREVLNKALRQFSRATDELIVGFKDNVIQIREDNSNSHGGLFSYDLSTDVVSRKLLEIELKAENVNDFCRRVMAWLWEITEECLKNVRERVQSELKPSYTSNISIFESRIEPLCNHATLQADLHTAINKAREELTAHIAKVEKWFYRQETKLEDFKISDHINLVFDTVGKYSPVIPMKMDCSVPNDEPVFQAQYSASMFDLLNIFFSNIFKYSLEEIERQMLLQVTIESGDIMHFHFENKLRSGVEETTLNSDFQGRVSNEKLIQKEGGSGLAKAMNIVKYDFGDTRNTFTIKAVDRKCITDIYIHLSNMTL